MRTRLSLLVLTLALLVIACTGVETLRPAEDFAAFMASYRADPGFRLDRAAYPVRVLIYAEDGVVRQLDLGREGVAGSVYKLYVDSAILREHGYVELVRALDKDKNEVMIGPPSSEASIGYVFRRIKGNWFLISIIDYWGV